MKEQPNAPAEALDSEWFEVAHDADVLADEASNC